MSNLLSKNQSDIFCLQPAVFNILFDCKRLDEIPEEEEEEDDNNNDADDGGGSSRITKFPGESMLFGKSGSRW